MNSAVLQAVQEISRSMPGCDVVAEPDDDGGAFVTVNGVDLGTGYIPATTFVGFRITFQYPIADIYPHFVTPDLRRADGTSFGEGFHTGKEWKTPSVTLVATMVSRVSRRRDAAIDTAATKLLQVLTWIRNQ